MRSLRVRARHGVRLAAPERGLATAVLGAGRLAPLRAMALAVALVCTISLPAIAQPKAKPDKAATRPDAAAKPDRDKKPKEKTFDFENLKLNGQLRTPQLLYFLERANEELERASLEKRSFIPHLVRSMEEEAL